MRDLPVDRYWIDSSATVGNGITPGLDYLRAVHLTIYWGQDMSSGPICEPAHPPKRLSERLRRGLPLLEEEIIALGEGRWPRPDEAFSLSSLPPLVRDAPMKEGGTTSWSLTGRSFFLRKFTPIGGCVYVGEVAIECGPPVRLRQRVMHSGIKGPIPGVAKNLKLISATCGLYDGGVRMLPLPIAVDTEEDAERLVALIESDQRGQPVVAVSCAYDEPEEGWRRDTEEYAREAFTLQHVAAVTVRGTRHLREMLGPQGLRDGAIKTYNTGFTRFDVPHDHPMTLYRTVVAHERGRKGMLARWRIRLMTSDGWARRAEPINIPPLDASL
jgi:hypothetical protein